MLSKKVEPGDFVSLDSGEMGYIKNISWRNTKMLERSNNLIHIPNTKLSTAIIKNYDSGDPSFSVKIPLGVSYDSDLDHVGKVVWRSPMKFMLKWNKWIKTMNHHLNSNSLENQALI